MRELIIKWFIEDITEALAWTDADLSEDEIETVAEKKADDLIKKCEL